MFDLGPRVGLRPARPVRPPQVFALRGAVMTQNPVDWMVDQIKYALAFRKRRAEHEKAARNAEAAALEARERARWDRWAVLHGEMANRAERNFMSAYDGKTIAEIIHDYAVIRGDLSEQYARDQLVQIIEDRIKSHGRRAVNLGWDAGWEGHAACLAVGEPGVDVRNSPPSNRPACEVCDDYGVVDGLDDCPECSPNPTQLAGRVLIAHAVHASFGRIRCACNRGERVEVWMTTAEYATHLAEELAVAGTLATSVTRVRP